MSSRVQPPILEEGLEQNAQNERLNIVAQYFSDSDAGKLFRGVRRTYGSLPSKASRFFGKIERVPGIPAFHSVVQSAVYRKLFPFPYRPYPPLTTGFFCDTFQLTAIQRRIHRAHQPEDPGGKREKD
jgi:hypothetical protein